MKNICALLILLFVCSKSHAQAAWVPPFPIDSITHEVSYHGVVKVANVNSFQLYAQAKDWHQVAAHEVSTKLPLKADRKSGLYIGRRIVMVGDKRFVFTVAVECHDGQYEYLFTHFQLLTPSTTTPTEVPGRMFTTFPTITPLQEVATAPANLTATGEIRPEIKKMLVDADMTFRMLVGNLMQTMARTGKS
jgi:hypothetical protein